MYYDCLVARDTVCVNVSHHMNSYVLPQDVIRPNFIKMDHRCSGEMVTAKQTFLLCHKVGTYEIFDFVFNFYHYAINAKIFIYFKADHIGKIIHTFSKRDFCLIS